MNTLSNFEFLIYGCKQGIGTLTINRPDKLNAINAKVLSELKSAFTSLKKIPHVELKGLIVTGAGPKAFIAGADIAELAELKPAQAKELSQLGQEVSHLIENFDRPVIACLNGHAMGGGLEMALACDFIYMVEQALVALPETKLGLIPGFGGTKRLANVVGINHAKEMIYSGRTVNASEALEIGLCLKVFATATEMLAQANEWIQSASKNSLLGIKAAKAAMQEVLVLDNHQALAVEANYFSTLFGTADMLEGTNAFLQKKPAQFKHQ